MPRLKYERINWEDAPSTATPLNAENLNTMDNAIAALFSYLGELEEIVDNLSQQDASNMTATFGEPGEEGVDEAPLQPSGSIISNILTGIHSRIRALKNTEIPELKEDVTALQNALPGMISDEIDDKFGQEIGDNVTSWLTEHVDPAGSAVVVDDTLTIEGAAADAKKVGEEISGLKIVVDDTLSIEGAAADAKKAGDEISSLKEDLNVFDPLFDTLMEQGGLSAVNVGSPLRLVDSANIIRSAEFQNWQAGMTVRLNDGYLARLLLCDSNENFIADVSYAQSVTSANTTASKVKVCIKKSDGSAIIPSEADDAVMHSDIPILEIQPKANATDVLNLKTDLEQLGDDLKPLYTSNMEQGSFSTVNIGSPVRLVDSANIIRSAEFQNWQAGMTVRLNDGYLARLLLCDSNENFIADVSYAQSVTSANTTASKVKVCIKKSDGSAIIPSEADDAVMHSDIPILEIQPKANATDVLNLKTDLEQLGDDLKPLYTSNMEQGSFSTVNIGSPVRLVDSTTRIRSKEMYAFSAGKKVVVKNGYLANLFLCDSDGGYITNLTWTETATSDNTTATKTWVIIKKSNEGVITADEAIDAILYSDFPLISIHPKANADDLNALETDVSNLKTDIAEFDSTRSTLYVYNNVSVELENGIYDVTNTLNNTGKHVSIPVEKGERYIVVTCGYSSSSYPLFIFRKNGSILSYKTTDTSLVREKEIIVDVDADELIVNVNTSVIGSGISYISVRKGEEVSAKPCSKWHGKKIAWFGTSIPETSGYNAVLGYPEYVGKLLGATVYNEAVGSSCARRGFKSAESATDPYGWTGMGIAALWNMGSTIEEKTEIISNWESKWRSLTGYDVSLTDAIIAKALACSYENKLVQKYITENPVDLYVFDHGYNDWKVGDLDMDTSDPFDRSTFQGAMNTFIKLILESNPRARILVVSHYEDQERPGLIEMQKNEAEYWNLPFSKLYENLGWANDRTVTTEGYWSNGTGSGIWIESGGTSQSITLKQYHMPDGRHPNTDISGHACMDIAYVLADFIDRITPS